MVNKDPQLCNLVSVGDRACTRCCGGMRFVDDRRVAGFDIANRASLQSWRPRFPHMAERCDVALGVLAGLSYSPICHNTLLQLEALSVGTLPMFGNRDAVWSLRPHRGRMDRDR